MKTLRRSIRAALGRTSGSQSNVITLRTEFAQATRANIATAFANELHAQFESLGDQFDSAGVLAVIRDAAARYTETLQAQGCSDKEEDLAIDRYVAQLTETERRMLALFRRGNRPSEIANVVGLSETAVKRSLQNTYAGLLDAVPRGVHGDRP